MGFYTASPSHAQHIDETNFSKSPLRLTDGTLGGMHDLRVSRKTFGYDDGRPRAGVRKPAISKSDV